MPPVDNPSPAEETLLVNRVPGNSHLPPILPPSPEVVKMMKEASKPRGTTYEQALAQTRNSLKGRQANENGSKLH